MIRRRPLASAALLALLALPGIAKDFPFDDFSAKPLAAAQDADTHLAAKQTGQQGRVVLPSHGLKHRTMVIASGAHRPLARDKQEVIATWGVVQGADPDFVKSFEEEFEVRQAGQSYWVAVERKVAIAWRREIAPDDKLELFYFSGIGALKRENGWDWVFLVAEFQPKK